jgi:hypothetical protein
LEERKKKEGQPWLEGLKWHVRKKRSLANEKRCASGRGSLKSAKKYESPFSFGPRVDVTERVRR